MLGTTSLNQPAGRPSGEALLSAVRGGAQDGGAKLQAGRKAEAEAKHAARLASTSTGARAAAMAALRASRRKAAVRLPAARTAAHDSASQTAAHHVCDSTSQTGFESADSVRLHGQPSVAQPAVPPPLGADVRPATPPPDVPRQDMAGGESQIMSTAPATAAMPREDQHEPAGSHAPLSPLALPSPPRRGRETLPSSPRAQHSDLALQMGLPPSPQLPARHRSGVPQLGRGRRSGGKLLAAPSATAAVAVAAAVASLPPPSQRLVWKPLISPVGAGDTDSVLLPAFAEPVTSGQGSDSTLPVISDSNGDSNFSGGESTSFHAGHGAAGQTALSTGMRGDRSIPAPAHEGLGHNQAASYARAERYAAPPADGARRSGSRPDLVSDIEALRQRWAAACDPTAARQGRHGALDDYTRRPLSRLFGRLHSGDPALTASPTDWSRGRGGVGNGAAYSPLGVLPPPSRRPGWAAAAHGLDLRCSFPGEIRHFEMLVWLMPLLTGILCGLAERSGRHCSVLEIS